MTARAPKPAPTTAERLRELVKRAKRDPFAESELETVLAACAEQIGAVLHAHGPVSMCDGPEVCPICALDRAIAKELDK